MLKSKEFGKAIEIAIQRKLDSGAAKSKAEIARYFGMQPPSLVDWVKKGSVAKDKLPKLFDYFSDVCTPSHWGLSDNSPMLPSNVDRNVRMAQPDTRRIPVLNKIPAGGPRQIIDDYHAGAGMEDISTDLDLGQYAFALIIDGDSMEPEFKTGDKVIIDPDVKPRPGDYVAAKCNGDEGTFKKYRPRGLNEGGSEVFELVPLNDDYPTIKSDMVRCEIIGVMVEHRRLRRK